MWKKYVPILSWLPSYNGTFFRKDLFAGITLTAYAIPVSLAYASLAGLPPQYGIYGYLIGGLFYAVFGSSKQLAIGPTSAISILVGTAVASLAEHNHHRWEDIAALTALIFAAISISAYFLRLSSMINFISETVLTGFKAGAALTIGISQLPKLFGVSSGGHTFIERLQELFVQLPNCNYAVLIFGIGALIFLIIGEKVFPGKPIAILVVIISTLLLTFTPLSEFGFKTVGNIPSQLPEFYLPRFHLIDLEEDAALAFACFLLAYIESVSAAKTLAAQKGQEIDVRQELLALGAANLGTAFGHGYPVSGGLSQSAVNDKAGAQTPMALVINSVAISVCLLFFTGLLKNLPTLVLSVIVIMAIKGLVNVNEFKRIWKTNKQDFLVLTVAFISVLMFGILQGVIFGAVVSLVIIIKTVSQPHVAFLGKIPDSNRYSDMARHPDNVAIPGLLMMRVESPLVYFNINTIYNTIWEKVKSEKDLKVVILDLSSSAYIDSAGANFIKKLYDELSRKNIVFRLAEAHSSVRDTLRKENIEHLFGHVGRRDSIYEVSNNAIETYLS